MVKDSVLKEFGTLTSQNKREEKIVLFIDLLKSADLTDTEKCWAYWNISDNLALLRKSNDELLNHKKFENQLSLMDKKYLFWIVSDATQKLTLLKGGYEQYWIDLYDYACKFSSKLKETARIRFESHRATVMIPLTVEYKFNKEHSLYALDNLKQSADEFKDSSEYTFYRLTYLTQAIGAHSLTNGNYRQFLDESLNLYESILPYFSQKDENNNYLLGSWEQLNAIRPKYKQAKVATNNYIIQLINAKEYKTALHCYEKIKSYDLNFNNYFHQKINTAVTMAT